MTPILFNFKNFNKKDLIKSFGVHFVVILILALAGLNLIDKIFFGHNKNNLVIIKSAVRVDVVGMPNMTVKQLQSLQDLEAQGPNEEQKEEKAQQEAKEVEIAKEAKVEDTQPDQAFIEQEAKKNFLENLKKISQQKVKDKKVVEDKKGTKDSKASKTGGNGLSKDAINRLVLEGNKLSQGSSLTGDVYEGDLGEFERYIQKIPLHVRPFWKLPSYLANQDLNCRIQIYVSKNGDLVKWRILESSGVDEFDSRAIDAVQKAAPFPKPNGDYSVRVVRGDIVLGFPL